MNIERIQYELYCFAQERDWDKFHTPKNLAMALSSEVGELLDHFQWLTQKESFAPADMAGVTEEIADVQIYLISLAGKLGIDIEKAVKDKINTNEEKYPPDKCRGVATKYTDL